MAEDYKPPQYSYGDEVDNTNMPQLQVPDLQWLYDAMAGNAGNVQDIINGIIGTKPNAMLPAIMQKLGVNGKQLGQWFMNNISGKGASERAGLWKDTQMGNLNRFATRQGELLQQGTAEGGGAGSSSAARQLTEGKFQLLNARNDVTAGAMAYEDQLKKSQFDKAMAGLGTVESLGRGDAAQALQYGGLLTGAGNLQLGLGQQTLDVGGVQINQSMIENAWNQYLYSEFKSKGGSFMEFLGEFIKAGATYGAAALGAGAGGGGATA